MCAVCAAQRNTMKDFINKIIVPACIYFTLFTVPFAFIMFVIYGKDGIFTAHRVAASFGFMLALAASNALLKGNKLTLPLRVALHAIITGVGFWLFMLLPLGNESINPLIGLLIYYVIYAVIMAIIGLRNASAHRRADREQEYSSMFKKD